jgi:hypothetical protein
MKLMKLIKPTQTMKQSLWIFFALILCSCGDPHQQSSAIWSNVFSNTDGQVTSLDTSNTLGFYARISVFRASLLGAYTTIGG